jgi:general secretion pathway protein G
MMKVVLGMLALLAAFLYVVPINDRRSDVRVTVAALQIKAFHEALEVYRADTGSFPDTEVGLGALRRPPSAVKGWQGPYLPKNIPFNPWNHPYIYDSAGPTVTSLGADGKPGGETSL